MLALLVNDWHRSPGDNNTPSEDPWEAAKFAAHLAQNRWIFWTRFRIRLALALVTGTATIVAALRWL
jgi:hypothetical protein